MCVSRRGWCDKRLGGEDTEYEQSGEVQQGTRHLHGGEGWRVLPVLSGKFLLRFELNPALSFKCENLQQPS